MSAVLSVIRDLLKYVTASRKLWLLPIILGLVALGGLLVLGQSAAVAPFLYAIF